MLDGLFIVIEVDIFEFLWVFMANEAFFMSMFKMSSELVNVIEGMFTEGACGMVEYEITVLTKLSIFDMFEVLIFRVEYLFWLYALPVGKTDIAVLFLMF